MRFVNTQKSSALLLHIIHLCFIYVSDLVSNPTKKIQERRHFDPNNIVFSNSVTAIAFTLYQQDFNRNTDLRLFWLLVPTPMFYFTVKVKFFSKLGVYDSAKNQLFCTEARHTKLHDSILFCWLIQPSIQPIANPVLFHPQSFFVNMITNEAFQSIVQIDSNSLSS